MTADSGQAFSLADVLEPLPTSCVGCVVDVLGQIDAKLAPPVLEAVLKHKLGLTFDENTIKNVVWKMQRYLPSLTGLRFPTGASTSQLKQLQNVAPNHALICIPARTGHNQTRTYRATI